MFQTKLWQCWKGCVIEKELHLYVDHLGLGQCHSSIIDGLECNGHINQQEFRLGHLGKASYNKVVGKFLTFANRVLWTFSQTTTSQFFFQLMQVQGWKQLRLFIICSFCLLSWASTVFLMNRVLFMHFETSGQHFTVFISTSISPNIKIYATTRRLSLSHFCVWSKM